MAANVSSEIRIALGDTTRTYGVGDSPITVGRASTDSFPIRMATISRGHLAVEFIDNMWWVIDNGSSNGVFDGDGRRIKRTALGGELQVALGITDAPTITIAEVLDEATMLPVAEQRSAGGHANPTSGPRQADIATLLPPTEERGPHEGETVLVGVRRERLAAPTPPPAPPVEEPPTQNPSSGGRITIGRGSANSIVIDDLAVSRMHCTVHVSPDGSSEIEDHSANGTDVDGQWVKGASVYIPPAKKVRMSVGASVFEVFNGNVRRRPERLGIDLDVEGVCFLAANGISLLDDVSFSAESGTLTAILGPSGSGKSTLVGLVVGLSEPTHGEVLLDGIRLEPGSDRFRERIGFVPQDDLASMHAKLTVRQWLQYSGRLRFAREVTDREIAEAVERTTASLGLTDRIDYRIETLSGGERKRVNVATEILTRPSMLVLDEPTSGLDPGYDAQLMALLRSLADDGYTVVVVTHTPSSVEYADRVVLLSDGHQVFNGTAEELGDFGSGASWAAVFQRLSTSGQRPVDRLTPKPIFQSDAKRATARPARSASSQYRVLVARTLKLVLTDKRGIALMAAQAPLVGLLIALISRNAFRTLPTLDNPRALMALMALVLAISYFGCANAIREIVKERSVFRRERFHGLSPAAYVAAKFTVLGSITALQAILLVSVIALRTGAPSSPRLPVGVTPLVDLSVAIVLTGVCCVALGLLVSSSIGTQEKAMSALPVLLLVMYLLSGGPADPSNSPVLSVPARVNPAAYGFAAGATSVDLTTLLHCERVRNPLTLDVSERPRPNELDDRCKSSWSSSRLNHLRADGWLVGLGAVCVLLTWQVLLRSKLTEPR